MRWSERVEVGVSIEPDPLEDGGEGDNGASNKMLEPPQRGLDVKGITPGDVGGEAGGEVGGLG